MVRLALYSIAFAALSTLSTLAQLNDGAVYKIKSSIVNPRNLTKSYYISENGSGAPCTLESQDSKRNQKWKAMAVKGGNGVYTFQSATTLAFLGYNSGPVEDGDYIKAVTESKPFTLKPTIPILDLGEYTIQGPKEGEITLVIGADNQVPQNVRLEEPEEELEPQTIWSFIETKP